MMNKILFTHIYLCTNTYIQEYNTTLKFIHSYYKHLPLFYNNITTLLQQSCTTHETLLGQWIMLHAYSPYTSNKLYHDECYMLT